MTNSKDFIKRLKFTENEKIMFDHEANTYSIIIRMAVEFVDMQDKMIVDKAIKSARENGFTDLCLIDKEFLRTALKNEIKRRKEEYEEE